jgi:hemoglobin-like flavoprotein
MLDDVSRIRKNWAVAIGARDIVGGLFYQNLFRIAPDTRSLFPDSLDEQGRKLVQTLSWILDHLEDPDQLLPAAQGLARRHVGYGVSADQYDAVGKALVATLSEALGDAFSDEDAAAWARIYGGLSKVMTDAAYPENA